MLREKFPGDDWGLVSEMPTDAYMTLRDNVYRALRSGPAAVRANNADVAELLAAKLEGVCVPAAGGFELFYEGQWVVKPVEHLHIYLKEHLASLSEKVIKVQNGQTVRALGTLPSPFGQITFRTGLVTTVLAHLAKKSYPPLDGDHARFKVLFNDGWLRDVKAGAWRRSTCADRMQRSTACSSVCFEADLAFLGSLTDFYANGGKSLYEEHQGEQATRAAAVKQGLEALEPKCELLRVLRAFADNYDEVLFLLRHMLRAAVAHPRFTQFLYIYGTGSSRGLFSPETRLRSKWDIPYRSRRPR